MTTETPANSWMEKGEIQGLLRLGTFFSLFWLLPLISSGFLIHTYFEKSEDFARQEWLEANKILLGQAMTAASPPVKIKEHFFWLGKKVMSQKIPAKKFPDLIKQAKRDWGFDFDFYLFDFEGKLRTPPAIPVRSRQIVEKFWGYLRTDDESSFARFKKTFNALFGELFYNVPCYRGCLQRFKGTGPEGLLYWGNDPYSTKGGFLFIVWEIPSPIPLLKAFQKKRLPHSTARILMKSTEGDLLPLDDKEVTPEEEIVSASFQDRKASWLEHNDRIWLRMKLPDHVAYLSQTKPWKGLNERKNFLFLILLLTGVGGFYLSYRWMVKGEVPYLSIRWKMTGIFLFTLIVPLSGFSVLAWKSLWETRISSVFEWRQKARNILQKIDDAFLEETGRLRKNFNRIYTTLQDPEKFRTFTPRIQKEYCREMFSGLEVWNCQTQLMGVVGTQISNEGPGAKLLAELFRSGMKKFIPDRIKDEGANQGSGDNLVLQSLVDTSSVGFSAILENPGKVKRLVLPRLESYVYWNFFPRPDHPAGIMAGHVQANRVRNIFLQRTLQNQRLLHEEGTTFFAADVTLGDWFPRNIQQNQVLEKIANQARLTQEETAARIILKGKPYLAFAMPGKQLSDYVYLAILPEERITRILDDMRRGIFFGFGLSLLLALLLSGILAETFLLPIGHLSRGIIALKEKKSRFRLTHFPGDELGDLARVFNDMMENLEELNSGKLVQSQLFPHNGLTIGAYSVAGLSKPATDLGGDYFDFLILPDESFLVLIGDVTGHGIPAALVMAMARAITARFSRKGGTLESFLEELNSTLFSTMAGKRLMTLAAIHGDPHSHQCRFYNFGHPYPILSRKSGSSEFLEASGIPMGFSHRTKLLPLPFTLEPGDRLILYTDGLVESLEIAAHADGFVVFQEFLRTVVVQPAQEMCLNILTTHPFMKTGLPQPDDFTVVILERRNETPVPADS